MITSVKEIINKIGKNEDNLIEILIELQKNSRLNYLSKDIIKEVSKELGISVTKIYGIADFYSMLSTEKRGENVIQICNSTPCYIRNGSDVAKIFEDILGIKMGEVTSDEMFSLEFVSCLGACDFAPAARINDKIIGNLNRGKIFNILAAIKRGEDFHESII